MPKLPATDANMRSTVFDYPWGEVAPQRGGPLKGAKEQVLAVDPQTGAYTRIILFEPGFKFEKALKHEFWEEILVLEGHMIDYGTGNIYPKGYYACRRPGVVHGPFGTELGCILFETTWYDEDWYLLKYGKQK